MKTRKKIVIIHQFLSVTCIGSLNSIQVLNMKINNNSKENNIIPNPSQENGEIS